MEITGLQIVVLSGRELEVGGGGGGGGEKGDEVIGMGKEGASI